MTLQLIAGGRLLRVEGRQVVEVASSQGRSRDPAALHGAEILPGRVCAHTHLYSGLASLGMPAPRPAPRTFLEILQRVWWRLDRALDFALLRAAARLYVAESLLAGTTALVDHHESPEAIEESLDVVAEACETLGIRALLCYGATERNGGREEARRGLAESARFARAHTTNRVRGLVGLHASFTVSDETIREAGALCRELCTALHVHVAEGLVDVEDAQARGYPGPLERLRALDAVAPGSILAHGVHLDTSQVVRATRSKAWLVHNPRSNHGNRVGYASALAGSERVALGTDGYPADLRVEVAAGRAEARAHGEDPTRIEERLRAGHTLLQEHFAQPFAPLAPGTTADVVVQDGTGAVRHVAVDGRLVVRDGRLLTGDLDAIRAEAREAAQRLWRRMGAF